MKLTPNKVNAITNALRLAADQYERDAATVGSLDARIMQQFQQQALDARDLADELEIKFDELTRCV